MQRAMKPNRSLTKVAYETIKEAICDSKIKQGDLLSENLIAQELGMSRTPVREALRMLAIEDFVEIKNGIGIYVKTVSYQDIRDIFEVRRSLEMLAVQTAIYEINEADVLKLEKKFMDLMKSCESDAAPDLHDFVNLDWCLHELLVERCRNNYVKTIMQSIHSNIKRFQHMSFEARGNIQESTEQHLKLLEMIRKKDIAGLTEAIDRHIAWSADCLLNKM